MLKSKANCHLKVLTIIILAYQIFLSFVLKIYDADTELLQIFGILKISFTIIIVFWSSRNIFFEIDNEIEGVTKSNFILFGTKFKWDLVCYILTAVLLISVQVLNIFKMFSEGEQVLAYFVSLFLISVYIYVMMYFLKVLMNNRIIIFIITFVIFVMLSQLLYTFFVSVDMSFLLYNPLSITEVLFYDFSFRACLICIGYIWAMIVYVLKKVRVRYI